MCVTCADRKAEICKTLKIKHVIVMKHNLLQRFRTMRMYIKWSKSSNRIISVPLSENEASFPALCVTASRSGDIC